MTVRTEIEGKLAAFAATRKIPIAYENVAFTPPATGNWIEVFFLAANRVSATLDASRQREYGMFQINVFGKVGVGMGTLSQLANDVAALFPVVPKEGITSIEAPPSIGGAMPEDEFIFVPITVRYRAEF